jgi:multiple sugar transport system substrate-binding protein
MIRVRAVRVSVGPGARPKRAGRGTVTFALAAILTLALSACANQGTGGTSEKPSGKIVVWDFNYNTEAGKSYQQVDSNFIAKFPGVTIEHVAKPAGEYGKVVQAAMAAKSGPDALMLQTPFAIKDYYTLLTPLNDLINADMKSQFAGWGGMNPDLDPNGKVYGIPYSFGGTAFYWNKAVFEKAGADPNKFPTSYDDLLTVFKKLKAAGITPIGGGDKLGIFSSWWMYAAIPGVMSLQDCYGLSNGKTKWSDPRVKRTLQIYLDWIKAGYFASNQAELNAGDFSGFTNWINGQAGVVWAFPGYRPKLAQDDAKNLGTAAAVIGIDAPAPHFYMAGPTLGWTIPTWTKNKTTAWEYIKYMTSTEAQQLHLDVDKVGPSNIKVDVSKADPDLTATFNLWKANPGNEHCGRTFKVDVIVELGKQMTAVEAGQQTLDGALKVADDVQAQHA